MCHILNLNFHSLATLVPTKGIWSLLFHGTVTHGCSRHAQYYSAKVDGTPVKDIAW